MTEKPVDYNELRDILSLVGKKLTRRAFMISSRRQRLAAVRYAGAAHFRASDNNNRVPPMPNWVRGLQDFKMGDLWPK